MFSRLSTLQMPGVMSSFHLHAVVPIIQCTLNTVSQPQLCHATLCILREVSSHITAQSFHIPPTKVIFYVYIYMYRK